MLTLETAQTIAAGSSTGSVALTIMGMELVGTTETYKVLEQGQLTSSVATVYTTPGSTTAFVKSMHAVNLSGVPETFAIYVGGTAEANRITPDITLGDGGWAVYDENGWQVYGSSFALGTLETDEGRSLLVVDTAQRRLLESLTVQMDELSKLRITMEEAFKRQ